MNIQRHLVINYLGHEPFGKYRKEHCEDFDWYIGNGKVGFMGNSTPLANNFISGILIADDELLVTPGQRWPNIRRVSERCSPLSGYGGSYDGINGLIDLLQNNVLLHMYESCLDTEVINGVVTFSIVRPSTKFYKEGKNLPASINKEELMSNERAEKFIASLKG